uniref:Uncharacterized protein n=1 Tax=Opuntia streptacantha TaxID=393608 RepID=A0A7C9A1T6_OPUST
MRDLVTSCSFFLSFESPKSATFGQKSSPRRMFSGLMSQCSTHSRHSSCKYAIALATPRAIRYLVFQSSRGFRSMQLVVVESAPSPSPSLVLFVSSDPMQLDLKR